MATYIASNYQMMNIQNISITVWNASWTFVQACDDGNEIWMFIFSNYIHAFS